MPLSTLVTNEVKDAAGAEVEFARISTIGRTFEYAQVSETPNLTHRIVGAHRETGAGTKKRRSSMIQVILNVTGSDGNPAEIKFRIVGDIPVGNLSTMDGPKKALAELGSLVFTNATSTFVYAGTGNGAVVLLNGEN
jgi:hypothetical protein